MAIENIHRYLDHAILRPELTRDEVVAAIQLGIEHRVRTVCVRPCDIPLAVAMCRDTATEVSCTLAFPHGCALSAAKADEARHCIAAGARELDMVVNYGLARSGRWDELTADIRAVTAVAAPAGVRVKAILETAMLSLEQIRAAVECAVAASADFVKTSTGFNGEGATVEQVRVMLETARGRLQVKPSGGIRDRARAELFLGMGAQRLGVNYTSTPAICAGGGGSAVGS